MARIAGVSQMTASRAINNQPGVSAETREEILRIADEAGYVVNRAAQKLSGGRTRILAVIAQLHTPFTSEVVLGVGRAARAANYEMLVYSLAEIEGRPPGAIVELLRQIADGVIAILPFASDYLATLADARVPIVTIDRGRATAFPAVMADNHQGARLAVQHLADLGHHRIGFIAGDDRLASGRDRRDAFEDTRRRLGLAPDPELIAPGDFLLTGGFDAARRLLALPKPPTAIFAGNDMSALGAMSALREANLRVPTDVSVVGFDDIPQASQLFPGLTTLRQPLPLMARAAVNTLLGMIAGIEAPTPLLKLPTDLIVRQSTAAPRSKLDP